MLDLSKRLLGFNKGVFLLLLFSFLLVSSVLAEPPFQTTEGVANELSISIPKFEYLVADTNFSFHVHVFNSTGYLLDNTSTSCNFHLYDVYGSHILEDDMTFDSNGVDFYSRIDASLLSVGHYSYITSCNNSQAGFVSGGFEVTFDGNDNGISSLAIFILVALFGFGLYVLGRFTRDYTTGILGSFVVFLLGVYVLIYPISGVAGWLNLLLGSVAWAWGAYVFIVGSIEVLKDKGYI